MSLPEFASNPVGYLVAALVITLGAYRIARFISIDSLTESFRGRLWDFTWKSEDKPKAAWRTYVYELMTCPHCLGVWASIGLVGSWYFFSWMLWPVFILGAAGAQSFLASVTE